MSFQSIALALSPLRYYPLTDALASATAVDLSTHAQNGTVVGTVTFGEPSLLKSDNRTSALFDGFSGSISVPVAGFPTGAGAFSFGYWFKMSSQLHSFEQPLNFGAAVGNENVAMYFNTDNILHVGFHSAGDASSGIAPALNIPHFAVATYDGATLSIYIDSGTHGGTVATTGNIVATTCNIGTDISTTFYFPGEIAHALIYGFALTSAQILQLYNAGMSQGILQMIGNHKTFGRIK